MNNDQSRQVDEGKSTGLDLIPAEGPSVAGFCDFDLKMHRTSTGDSQPNNSSDNLSTKLFLK